DHRARGQDRRTRWHHTGHHPRRDRRHRRRSRRHRDLDARRAGGGPMNATPEHRESAPEATNAASALTELEPGQEVLRRTYAIDRGRLVRYAGASGDFNPIHYSDRAATEAGLPGVIAHGMLTMG